jgi:hypothetical protein
MAKTGENDKMAEFQFMMTTFKIHGNVVEFKFYEPRPILHRYTPQLELFEVLIKSVVTVSKQNIRRHLESESRTKNKSPDEPRSTK